MLPAAFPGGAVFDSIRYAGVSTIYFMNAESASSAAFISGKARPELACASEPNVVVGLLMQGLKVGCHVGPM
jgi:hypothetical protein